MEKEYKKLSSGIFNKLVTIFKRYICFRDERHYSLVVAYVFLTYFDIFDFIPNLYIRVPGDGSENTCGELLAFFCKNPIRLGYITIAALLQTIKEKSGTLFFDTLGVAKILKNYSFREILSASNKRSGPARLCNKKGDVVEYSTFCPKVFLSSEEINDPVFEASVIEVQMKTPPVPLERLLFSDLEKKFADDRDAIKTLCQSQVFKEGCVNFSRIEGISGYDELRWMPPLTIARVLDKLGETNALFDQLVGLAKDSIRARLEEKFFSDKKTRVLYLTFVFISEHKSLADGSYVAEAIQNYIQEVCGLKISIEGVGRILNYFGVIDERKEIHVPWDTSKRIKFLDVHPLIKSKSPVANTDDKPRPLKICYIFNEQALEEALSDCVELVS